MQILPKGNSSFPLLLVKFHNWYIVTYIVCVFCLFFYLPLLYFGATWVDVTSFPAINACFCFLNGSQNKSGCDDIDSLSSHSLRNTHIIIFYICSISNVFTWLNIKPGDFFSSLVPAFHPSDEVSKPLESRIRCWSERRFPFKVLASGFLISFPKIVNFKSNYENEMK